MKLDYKTDYSETVFYLKEKNKNENRNHHKIRRQ